MNPAAQGNARDRRAGGRSILRLPAGIASGKHLCQLVPLADRNVERRILGVINFPQKLIGPIRSEFLVAGFYRPNGAVVPAIPEREVPDGSKLA